MTGQFELNEVDFEKLTERMTENLTETDFTETKHL